MQRSLTRLIFADCLFVFILSLSSFFGGNLEWPLYAAAFMVPVLVLSYLPREQDFKMSVLGRSSISTVSAVSVFPIIFLIFIVSFLTSLFMGLVGIEGVKTDVSGNLLSVIVVSAFAPAVFEEMLFRYLPARYLAGYSKKLAVIYSSVLFALAHGNAFQIPYALVAGAMFMAVDIVTESVMPSIAIHFLNNLLSILWQRESGNERFALVFVILLSALTLISLAAICLNYKKIKEKFSAFF